MPIEVFSLIKLETFLDPAIPNFREFTELHSGDISQFPKVVRQLVSLFPALANEQPIRSDLKRRHWDRETVASEVAGVELECW